MGSRSHDVRLPWPRLGRPVYNRPVRYPGGSEMEAENVGPSAVPAAPTRVLVVDDDPGVREVIGTLLGEEGYLMGTAASAEEALEACKESERSTSPYQLVLTDMRMAGRDGLWLLDRLRGEFPSTAVIVLTAFGDTELAVDCLRRGAADYLLKPPKIGELVRAIERALAKRRLDLARSRYRSSLESRVREKTAELSRALRDLEKSYNATLYALVQALDAREHETNDHSERVVRFTVAIAEKVGVPPGQLPHIGRGALLHDIGKIGVPDAILLKEGPLTDEEWKEMRLHPHTGWNMIEKIPFLKEPAEIVLSHQERWDGEGYPRQLAGEAIPLGARIFAVADAFDALMNDRPYRKGTTFAEARKEVARCAGTQFDPRCVAAFLSIDEATWRALAKPTRGP
jgi:response regulator RpfG family c-di-GMP phosphodiesterase